MNNLIQSIRNSIIRVLVGDDIIDSIAEHEAYVSHIEFLEKQIELRTDLLNICIDALKNRQAARRIIDRRG
jgi:hypothetical protein